MRRINRFRWGTRSPDSTGYRPIEWGDTTQREMVRRGYHVISPRRSAADLTDEEHALVATYGALTTAGLVQGHGVEAETTFRELLGRCYFVEPAAIDIDGKCKVETGRLKDIVEELCRRHGLRPRWSYSGGSDRAGYHADFGEFQDWPKEQRSLAWLNCLRGIFSNDPRLQAVGAKGFYLVGGDPKNCIDLSPANGSQKSRGKIVRALGARYKAGSLNRKELCPGETDQLYTVPASLLDTAPQIIHQVSKSRRADFSTKRAEAVRRYERRPLEIPAGTRILTRVAEVLKTIRKTGHNHELFMLLTPTIQERFFGPDRKVWQATFQAAGMDAEDLGKVWDTTIARRKSGAPVKSTTQARQHLGAEAIGRLAAALAADLDSSYGEARTRFGYDHYQPSDIEILAELHGLDKRIVNRLKRVGQCKKFQQRAECEGCEKPQFEKVEPCDVYDLCPACSLIRARQIETWLADRWQGLDVVVGRRKFQKRQAGLAWAQHGLQKTVAGDRAARITVPELDGTWTLYIIGKRRSRGAGLAIAAGDYEFLDAKKAAALVGSLLMRPYEILRALFRAGKLEEWASLANRMLGSHIVTGAKNSSLPWPTRKILKEIASEYANGRDPYINEAGEEVGPCHCAAETPVLHTYTHRPTKTLIVEKARHPASISELTAYFEEMVLRGQVVEQAIEARPLYVLRE